MRSKVDEKRHETRGTKRGKTKSPKGGKALQRLLTYLAERDPLLIGDVFDTIEVPKSSWPKIGAAPQGLSAKDDRPAGDRTRPTPTACRAFAAAIAKAAKKVSASQPRVTRGARARRALATPTANETTWTAIGPSNCRTRPDVWQRAGGRQRPCEDRRHRSTGHGPPVWLRIGERRHLGEHGCRATWAARTDRMPTLAIGAVTFDPQDPKRVYAGSGEGNFYANLGAEVTDRPMAARHGRCSRPRRLLA